MFTQKISMDCTQEQYEKYLKDELLKMGYEEEGISDWGDDNDYITNFFGGEGGVGNINKDDIHANNATYLGSFNAPLFLALAAMTNKAEGNYGEYVIGLINGKFYKMKQDDKILPEFYNLRKATKEEIMAKFGTPEYKIGDYLTLTTRGGNKCMGILKYPLAKDDDDGFIFYAGINALKELHLYSSFGYWSEDTIRHSTKEEIEEIDKRLAEKGRYFDKKRLEIREISRTKLNIDETNKAISLLKSKGYKILKPKTWEEI